MKIPRLIDDQASTTEERIVARLQYMINYAAVQVSGKGTYKSLADFCNLQPATISQAVARGQISPEVAVRIEDSVGSHIITHTMLRHPLEVESE